ncbi:hypothetical protein M0804_008468 [Polistes exclamans]|nr:hypothetical protein M0804_008468 [Polistes exclamans]
MKSLDSSGPLQPRSSRRDPRKFINPYVIEENKRIADHFAILSSKVRSLSSSETTTRMEVTPTLVILTKEKADFIS